MNSAAVAAPPRAIAWPLITFLVLGCALSWYPWVLHDVFHRPGNPGPNPLGLLLAALIAAAVANGWRGSVEVLRSIVRVRAPLIVWSAALFFAPILIGLALAAASRLGIAVTPVPPNASDLLDRFLIMFLFVALGEEPAWRGFMLPLLQRAHTPLVSTLIIATVWAIWHLPLMGTEFAWPLVPMFLISLVGAAFIQTWLYNASRGSSLLPMLMHAILNTAGSGYAFQFIAANDLARFWWIYSLIWLVGGLAVVVATRGRLGKA